MSNDLHLLRSAVPSALQLLVRSRRGRLNLFYTLEERATHKSSADRPFLLFEGRRYTYKQTYEQALRYGAWLRRRHGVRPRDIVAMDFQNSELFVFLWFGLWSIGARPAFINYNLTGHALVHCVQAATTRLMVVDPAVAAKVDDATRKQLPDVKVVILTPQIQAEIAEAKPVRAPDVDRSGEKSQEMAMLIYTSGTTGLPKPAIVSYAKCIIGSNYTSRWIRRTPDSVMYTVRRGAFALVVFRSDT